MKILASDFDNTIYFLEDIKKTKTNVNAITNFIKEGNKFLIITGRNYTDLKRLINEYKIPYNYLICEDGAKIFNANDECLKTNYLNSQDIEQIIKILKELNLDFYLDDGYNKTTNINNCVKIVLEYTDREKAEKIISTIKKQVDIHIYISSAHINIIAKDVNKKNALNSLLNIEKFNKNDIYAIGDNDNDFEMLQYFTGAVVKDHHKILDTLEKEEYATIASYIEKLMTKEN